MQASEQMPCGRKLPYYAARETGAENAIRFMADQTIVRRTIRKCPRPIQRRQIRRVSSAIRWRILRLPDGSPEGDGYADTGDQSLRPLAQGQIQALTLSTAARRTRAGAT